MKTKGLQVVNLLKENQTKEVKMIIRSTKKLILFLLIFPIIMTAQDKKHFNLQDLIPGGKSYIRTSSLKQLQWMGNDFFYQKGDSLIISKPEKKEKVLLTLTSLNNNLAKEQLKELRQMPQFSVPYKDKPILQFRLKKQFVFYNTKQKSVIAIYPYQKGATNFDFSEENNSFAFTSGNNLYIQNAEEGITTVASSNSANIVFGQAVHQREFGIEKGTFWSPKGNALAFYRMDESMVTDYPIVDIDARCAKAKPFKYPMAGMPSHHVTVGVYNLSTKKTVWIKTGTPKEKYLTNIAWSPDEKSIYIAELNRDQNEMHLVRYSAITGKKDKVLFSETNSRYVEPETPMLFIPNNPNLFIWQSRKSGFNHLYLYNTEGKELKQLTKGNWLVTNVLGFGAKNKKIYFSSTAPHPICGYTEGSPLGKYIWSLDWQKDNTLPECISWNLGMHTARMNASGTYLIDRYESPKEPNNISLIRLKDVKEVSKLYQAKNPYSNYEMPEISVGTIKAADKKTDLYYRLVKPLNYDMKKKYPTIIYVYGGPHAQLITGGFNYDARGWDIYMAQKGYVVFTIDNRGSANRGFAFESVIHRNLGTNEMADQMEGVAFLKTLPFVDKDRIGVHGWSFGGFMTTNLMCSFPDVFKVGVAGGPVIDWKNYEIMYGERYMDKPQDNPEGYKQANLKLKAKKLKGHLLLIHGTSDPVVVWQHSLSFIKACINANTYPDYFVYPGHLHNVIGKDRPHLYEKITRYFDDYLK